MCVAGPSLLHALGATKKELIKLETGVSTANNAGLTLLGGLFCNIVGWAPGGKSMSPCHRREFNPKGGPYKMLQMILSFVTKTF